MSQSLGLDSETLPPALALRVDEVCDRFEADWQAGRPARIEEYLGETSEPEHSARLRELVKLEVYYRRRHGENPRLEDYQNRFPGLDPRGISTAFLPSDPLPLAPGSVINEVTGSGPPRTPRIQQLRCPHCHSPIPLGVDQPDRVLCSGCGSSFQLLRDSWSPPLGGQMRLFGKFQLLERVGLGAFGAVWRARDTELDRIVAVKIPHTDLANLPPGDVQRFYREARAAAQLQHPGIVTVHEVTLLQEVPAIVSDFVDGQTLKDLLQERRLSFGEAARLLAEVAEALDYAHALGLVHRDIKPANIMVEHAGSDPDGRDWGNEERGERGKPLRVGRPRIVDFGLALREQVEMAITADGQLIGTPAYMSPEQAAGRGHQVDRRSDIYSLGVVLYELLCGELPFRGSKAMLIQQVLVEAPRPPRWLNDKIPRDLETICLTAMAKEPSRRYATARALAEDLQHWLRGEPIRARPVRLWERGLSWAKRRPAIAALLLLVCFLTVLGFGLVTWQWRRAEAAGQLAADRAAAETKAKEHLERNLYFQQIALAERELSVQNFGRAAELLDACASHLRGWEWHYLKRLPDENLPSLQHAGEVWSVAFSSDGRRLAAGSADGTVTIWEAATGKKLRAWRGHDGRVTGIAFSPDGRRLASGGEDQLVKLWDATTGEAIHALSGHTDTIYSVAFSSDNRCLASASRDQTVRIWGVTDGQPLFSPCRHSFYVKTVVFSRDGQRLVSADWDGTVKVWDAATGQEVSSFRGPIRWTSQAAFCPNGRHVALASWDGTVRVLDAATGQEVLTMQGHTAQVYALAYSPDGQRLASVGYDKMVKVWDTKTGQEALTLRGHANRVLSVAYSPDGRRLASGGGDNAVKIWDASPLSAEEENSQVLTLQGHTHCVISVAYSPDSRRLASASWDGTVKVWDVAAGRRQKQRVLPLFTCHGHTAKVFSVSYSPDGRRLASAGWDATARVWDATRGEELHAFRGGTIMLHDVAFSPDGRYLAAARYDNDTVKVWDTTNGREALTLHGDTSVVRSVAYRPDGRHLAAACQDETIRVWDTTTGRAIHSLRGHEAAVRRVAYSPDGQRLASASEDQTVKLWDANTGEELRTLRGHTNYVFGVAFSPDGRRLASGSWDQTVRIWDAATGRELHTLRGSAGSVWSVTFSPDGRSLASSGGYAGKGEIKIWNTSLWNSAALEEKGPNP